MGKTTGFLDYKRTERPVADPVKRVKGFEAFHGDLPLPERQKQGARCMNCGVPFCQSDFGCPLHNLIPEWNDEVFNGNWSHALSRLLKTNNFPEFTGRVCPAPCECACVCGLYGDSPVTVRDNELAVIEYAYASGLITPKLPAVRTGRTVAVIGSGPAGLAVADQLNQRGHTVTVYERDDRIGGLLMYGIPNMKLDKAVVDRRVQRMAREGVIFEPGVDASAGDTAGSILAGYDAVVLCCGARQARDVSVENPDVSGVYQAMEYLTESTRALLDQRHSGCSAKGKNVVIIGNGDTATDCVATAIRQGAASVTQLVRKPAPGKRDKVWPYQDRNSRTDYGQEEAIASFGHDPRMYETVAKRLVADGTGNLIAVMVETAGQTQELPAQMLLIAAGFSGAERRTAEAFGLTLDGKGCLGTADHRTEKENIFAAGDLRLGASLVVTAIADGRACARAVDAYLEGYTNL